MGAGGIPADHWLLSSKRGASPAPSVPAVGTAPGTPRSPPVAARKATSDRLRRGADGVAGLSARSPCKGRRRWCTVSCAPRGPGGPPVWRPGWGVAGKRRSVGHPASREAREGGLVARPLFENSTACRKSVPSSIPVPGPSGSGLGFLWLIDIESVQFSVLGLVQASTESLILAQDERWRRA